MEHYTHKYSLFWPVLDISDPQWSAYLFFYSALNKLGEEPLQQDNI